MNRRQFLASTSGLFIPAAMAGPIIQSGARLFPTPGGGGGGSFTPDLLIDFDGLTPGNAIGSVDEGTGVAGKRHSYWGRYTNGYGARAVSGEAAAGKTTCAEYSIQKNSSGGWNGGSPSTNGGFGGGISTSAGVPKVYAGETMWYAVRMKFPVGFDFTTDLAGFTKFLRGSQSDPTATGVGRLDNHIAWGSGGVPNGWTMYSELGLHNQDNFLKVCDRCLEVDGQYHDICVAITPSYSDIASQVWRLWYDNQLAMEYLGDRYINWFQDGEWKTQDITVSGGTPKKYLGFADSWLSGVLIFTYWNGGDRPGGHPPDYPTQDQKCYTQLMAFHKTLATLTGIDEFGNKFINLDDLA